MGEEKSTREKEFPSQLCAIIQLMRVYLHLFQHFSSFDRMSTNSKQENLDGEYKRHSIYTEFFSLSLSLSLSFMQSQQSKHVVERNQISDFLFFSPLRLCCVLLFLLLFPRRRRRLK